MINSRVLLITFFVFAAFIGLVVQLFYVQIGGHDKYSARAEKQQNKIYEIKAERGIIYDRNGEILAYTEDDVSLFADSRMLKKNPQRVKKLADELSKVFKTNPNKYVRLINSAKGNVCLEKKITKEKSLLINNFVMDGFFKTEDYTRVYPYGNITSHILGYVDKDCNGKAGIEQLYDEELRGEDGELFVENDAIGRSVSIDYDNSVLPVAGNSFYLTIDKVYQKILSNELRDGIKEFEGESGIGIIANPKTGEILALANVPDFNPHEYFKVSDFVRRNRALTDTYEPGSTMKSVVMAMLLEENLANEKQVINTENGKLKIKGAIIRDTHKFDKLTVQEVLEQSSNIGMVKLSDRIKPNDFYRGLRDFGFGNLSSIDLIGETKGNLKKPDSFSGISKAFIAHGYEISVTPIQMVMAYSAIINGGKLLQPHILKKVVNPDGEIEEEISSVKIRNVISKETSERMKKILLGVVENGTGSNAQQENIYVGGKTGTAQKLIDGRYSSRKYNSSFVGFFPADDPEIICLVLVDSPQKGRYGGQVAAPIFSNITKKILETDFSIKRNKNRIERESVINKFMVNIEEFDLNDEVDSYANVADEVNEEKVTDKIVRSTMPNLQNKSLREAISILSDLKIKYTIKGSGKVVEQSIKKGTPLIANMTCVLNCANNIN
ncbi:MAG: transpeptidase family protein [Ignavibacteriae bacterium]|nr:transpeptidase family protein [Ignavibacteriota bacterium]MCB9206949.1 transpeptidase family protein [Ignavibacteriales bacterium]MCB9210459.1 transpeptidase family protein [Ignavibacteriales bacterium]MCB9219730.1 transpeptidase family protein [Ignavibacteriales bacterium]